MTWRRFITDADEIELDVAQKSSNYTIVDADDVILCTGTITITLPDATGARQKVFRIKKIDAGGSVTVNTNGGTIDGATSVTLTNQYDQVSVISDGSNYWKF